MKEIRVQDTIHKNVLQFAEEFGCFFGVSVGFFDQICFELEKREN